MDMNILQASRSEGDVIIPTLPAKSMTRDQLILRLMDVAGSPTSIRACAP